jgi:hypothetical protein
MPQVDIEINDFLSNCGRFDIQELKEALVEDGWIKQSRIEADDRPRGYDEQTFEDALEKLHGKWNRLTKKEEEQIIKIANRF